MNSPRNTLLIAIALAGAATALQDGIGRKPHMGWSSWNVAQCDAASAKYALDTANKFVSLGLKDLGYECKLISRMQGALHTNADSLCQTLTLTIAGRPRPVTRAESWSPTPRSGPTASSLSSIKSTAWVSSLDCTGVRATRPAPATLAAKATRSRMWPS